MAGTKDTFEKAVRKTGKAKWQRSTTNSMNGRQHWHSLIITQTGYYKKGICHLVANLLSHNNTKYY